MNVQPTLISHPKFVMYKNELGDPSAMEYLLRVWGHCQTMKRGENWGKVTADYLEAIAEWRGTPGKLWQALSKPFCSKRGWVHTTGKGEVIITNWEEHNHSLINSWEAGRKGGRPPTKPRITAGKPTGNPRITAGKPTENPTGLDLTGLERTGVQTRERAFPEVQIPSLEEVLAYCAGPAAIPEETGRAFWLHYEKTVLPPWTDGGSKHFQWQGKLVAWQTRDRAEGRKTNLKTPDEKTRVQLEAELEQSKDPEQRAQLREKIKKLA